jgi:ferredoxin
LIPFDDQLGAGAQREFGLIDHRQLRHTVLFGDDAVTGINLRAALRDASLSVGFDIYGACNVGECATCGNGELRERERANKQGCSDPN